MSEIYQRSSLLLGSSAMSRLAAAHVAVFGVGGVGSWCAEALLRTGITRLTIVDSDCVAESNINRQLMATMQTVGRPKVEVLKERLLTINPQAEITAVQAVYTAETAERFNIPQFDAVVDAIDSVPDKANLILETTAARVPLFSSMGAALKTDPTRIAVAEFGKVKGCPLAAALRKRFKKTDRFPRRKFKCVYSEEVIKSAARPNEQRRLPDNASLAPDVPSVTAERQAATAAPHDWNLRKAQINGSLLQITGVYGFTLAGLVINHLAAEPA